LHTVVPPSTLHPNSPTCHPKCSPTPASCGFSTDNSPLVNHHPPFLKHQFLPLTMLDCPNSILEHHTHQHSSAHTHHHSLSLTSPWRKCTSMSKTPHQFFPLFYPAVALCPYDKITAHLNCLHVCNKTVIITGSSLIW
jgi:hypothetical protein